MQLFVCGGITLENAKLEAESEAAGRRTEQASMIRQASSQTSMKVGTGVQSSLQICSHCRRAKAA